MHSQMVSTQSTRQLSKNSEPAQPYPKPIISPGEAEETEARKALRAILSFRGILEGAVKVEDRLLVASELSKVQGAFVRLSKSKINGLPDLAKEASIHLFDFAKMLPDYDNQNFKLRREAILALRKAETFSARIIAVCGKISREEKGSDRSDWGD